ncbi:sodium:calcium antiporter [Anaerotalea alkaliphila]|uniref:Sodium:calcium antiporter n=1 Tax=Anaerotalea alkaliphila TaxID=2662126 RepID=A0A7X5KM00_9FIRM|nr:sodium:calcium antiporter [Anaerotalea alkaliphila]NDL67411.1 sodium:calcium antiporter [Anaerotalea alkaliphila]
MDAWILHTLEPLSTFWLFLIIFATLLALSKGADLLVDEAVSLSLKWGIPKMIVGATIVSLGTTLPEASVSVLAAINGNADLALGNAIGSIIADSALIIGVAAMLGKLYVDPVSINHQGRVQIGAVLLLSVISLPFFSLGEANGRIHQWLGFLLLALLAAYIFTSIHWARSSHTSTELEADQSPLFLMLAKLIGGGALVILSSKLLIPSVELAAVRVGIPQSVIAATLVAFGTSLPELMTAITAARKGHGELAIGNIIGADILNVLFVVGAAAAATPAGLVVPLEFYKLQIPAMLLIVLLFRIFCKAKKMHLGRREGVVMLSLYGLYLLLNYTII